MILAYRLTGQLRYLTNAIAQVDQFVADGEAAIAAGGTPPIAGDSYLDVGNFLEDLALTYDHGFDQLTPAQRQRWSAYAEQSVFNVWHPDEASWGGVSHPWTGWAICDPGNNYHFSFLRATMLWALATQNPTWFGFLQTQKFGPLMDYYAALPGGGTREGTGYGTALNNLFGNYIYWKASTGEDLAGLTPHTRETIDYWVHATVPTLDRFAPIADLSRESIPNLYDYQENLVHEAVLLSAGTAQARRGTWWLQHNSVNGVASVFNIAGDLLAYPDTPLAPTDLMYHATGAGALFARTSWDSSAAWMAIVGGKYDQSHAHQEQGSFTFFKNDWLSVTSNIWSHSGIHQEVDVNNVIRFERSNGASIPQNQSDTLASTMTAATAGGATTVSADLTNAYSANRDAIFSWTRTFQLSGDVLRVTDACSVASGVRPIFQLQVPATPVLQADGSIQAGALRIVLLQPATASVRGDGFVGILAGLSHRSDVDCGLRVQRGTAGRAGVRAAAPAAATPTATAATAATATAGRSDRGGLERASHGDADQEPGAAHALHRRRTASHPGRRPRRQRVGVPARAPSVRVSGQRGAFLRRRTARRHGPAERERLQSLGTASAQRPRAGRPRADREVRAVQPGDERRRHADQRAGAGHHSRRRGAGAGRHRHARAESGPERIDQSRLDRQDGHRQRLQGHVSRRLFRQGDHSGLGHQGPGELQHAGHQRGDLRLGLDPGLHLRGHGSHAVRHPGRRGGHRPEQRAARQQPDHLRRRRSVGAGRPGAERRQRPAPRSSRATASAEACFASTAATDGRSADWPPVRGTCSSASGPSSTWSTRRTI